MKRTTHPSASNSEDRHDSHKPQHYYSRDEINIPIAQAMKSKNEHFSTSSTQHQPLPQQELPQFYPHDTFLNSSQTSNSHHLKINPIKASNRHLSAPPHPTISPSSRASELGRRLAQERQKNHELSQQVHELQGRLDQLGHKQSLDTAVSNVVGEKPAQPKNVLYLNHIRELQKSLQLETERRERVERQLADSFVRNMTGRTMSTISSNDVLDDDLDCITGVGHQGNSIMDMSRPTNCSESLGGNNTHQSESSELRDLYDNHVADLLERAKRLLSDSNSSSDDINKGSTGNLHDPHRNSPTDASQHYMLTYDPSYQPNTQQSVPLTQTLMNEFQSLLEGFYIEQRQKDEISQMSSNHQDILWLFEELEWRFEEIRRGYEKDWAHWNNDSMQQRQNASVQNHERVDRFDADEWKACLRGLVEVVASHHGGFGNINNDGFDRMLREVHRLHQQLSSVTLHHEQKSLSLNREIQVLKENHERECDEKSKTIEMLESKVAEQNETIARLQQEMEHEKSVLDNEKHKNNLSKESMTARIHYLEEIVHSFKAEAKIGRPRGVTSPTKNMSSNLVSMEFHQRILPHAEMNSPFHHSPSQFSNGGIDGDKNNAHEGEKDEKTSLILCLQQQIQELGMALQQSEEERANSIEEFQNERENYIRQYKEMSDILKGFLDSDNLNCNGSQQL